MDYMRYPQVCSGNITENFAIWEMANKRAPDNIKLVITPGMIRHAQKMQQLREWYNKPLNVSSWYRSIRFNSQIGGAKNSPHLRGMATDILLPGLTDKQRKNFAEKWQQICAMDNVIGGVTFYDWGIHFDSNSDEAFGCKTFRTDDLRNKK